MSASLAQLPAGTVARLRAFAEAHVFWVEGASLAGAIAIFLASVLPHLGNFPAVTDDEVWVLSASYKLAHDGVFGSDMFAGFFGADRHYYFNMPGHHVMIAGAFKLLGYGIAQARLVGVGYGVATLLLSYLLARRLYGVPTAVLTLGLLLFLRLNMGFDTGLPLQELSVNLRYDLAPVPFMLGGVLLLLGRPLTSEAGKPRLHQMAGGPSWRRAVLAGALFGVAILMQFYGAFIFPIAIAFLWTEALPRAQRLRLISLLVGAGMLVCLPYGLYILADQADFKGQAGTIDQRADFTRPGFYIDNLRHESDRFARPLAIPFRFTEVSPGEDPFVVAPHKVGFVDALPRRPSAKLGVLLGLPAAVVYAGLRALRERSRGDRLLLLCLVGLVAQYALLESAKFYIYWIPIVPFLCIGASAAALSLLTPPRRDLLRLGAATATVVVLLLVFAEGSVARVNGMRTAAHATDYNALATVLHTQAPPGSRVVGSTSLWWGLRDTDYRSYFLFFYLTRRDIGPTQTTIRAYLRDFDAQYLVLTRLAQAELEKHLSPADYADWQTYMSAHATKVGRIEGRSTPDRCDFPGTLTCPPHGYGYVDIWRFDR